MIKFSFFGPRKTWRFSVCFLNTNKEAKDQVALKSYCASVGLKAALSLYLRLEKKNLLLNETRIFLKLDFQFAIFNFSRPSFFILFNDLLAFKINAGDK